MVTIDELLAQIAQLQTQLVELMSSVPSRTSIEFNFNNNFFISDEDIRILAQNETKREGYKKIFRDGITEMRYEINRLEKFIDNFSQKGVALMTIAGLISLLPYAFSGNAVIFLKHYLIWIFPFLLASILTFIFSLPKRHTYRTSFSTAANNVSEELIMLRNEALAVQSMWRESYLNYKKSLNWHRISSIFLQVFLLSYVLNFYFFIFSELPNVKNMIFTTAGLLLVGVILYVKSVFIMSYNRRYGSKRKMSVEQESSVGAVPPDVDIWRNNK